ncbi:SMI1/KNR4 family protein [Bacillus cereus]|nr:SMI1/KNR4 family protein [Bacillus cereus]PEX92659.1 SMI1/KNR4 family protein [Bacillus cereus]
MEKVNWLFTEELIEEKIISKVEKSLGVIFPQDYKECVMKYNGGCPEPDNFNFENGGEGVINNLLSFANQDMNIEMFYDPIQPEIEGIVPFARDPFGNLICFDYRADKLSPTIVFWDHEEQGEAAIEIICNTFSELLDGLYDE